MLTIIVVTYGRLNSICVRYLEKFKHSCTACCFFAFAYWELAAMIPEWRVYFLYYSWKNSTFKLVRIGERVGWPIKEGILFSGVAMKIIIHQNFMKTGKFLCKTLQMMNLRKQLLIRVREDPIKITPRCTTSTIAQNNTIWIQHGYHIKIY